MRADNPNLSSLSSVLLPWKDWHCSLTCRSAMKRKKELAALLNWEYRNRGRNVRTLYFAVLYERKKRPEEMRKVVTFQQWPQYKTTWHHLQNGLTYFIYYLFSSHVFSFSWSLLHQNSDIGFTSWIKLSPPSQTQFQCIPRHVQTHSEWWREAVNDHKEQLSLTRRERLGCKELGVWVNYGGSLPEPPSLPTDLHTHIRPKTAKPL